MGGGAIACCYSYGNTHGGFTISLGGIEVALSVSIDVMSGSCSWVGGGVSIDGLQFGLMLSLGKCVCVGGGGGGLVGGVSIDGLQFSLMLSLNCGKGGVIID